eukprot:NODE_528_length_2139_cov_29.301435_g486_i0.p1 GENE.NODE_528_length_2139_cov_29.301435_g486_i0~~NODE_528_length_2139_cov_29.301435_g486_i0.p1  ORF type:complete len:427 (-),score=57.84 NODE_528_length_2139_cov_29.301435_g486_i0:763-2043(-)
MRIRLPFLFRTSKSTIASVSLQPESSQATSPCERAHASSGDGGDERLGQDLVIELPDYPGCVPPSPSSEMILRGLSKSTETSRSSRASRLHLTHLRTNTASPVGSNEMEKLPRRAMTLDVNRDLSGEALGAGHARSIRTAQHATAEEPLSITRLLPVRPLGRGQHGSVHLMEDWLTKRLYAEKVIDSDFVMDVVANELLAYDLMHTNVVQTLESYEKGGAVHIVQEYVDGGSLQQLLHRLGVIAEPVLCCIGQQLLRGLEYLHSHNPTISKRAFIHRDLKLDNVLLSTQGFLKIADFGLLVEAAEDGCREFVGPWQWMSPERIQGGRYHCSADIWSYGLMMSELFSGDFPIENDYQNFMDFVVTITTEPVQLPDQLTPALREHISACLQIDPVSRLSASSLLDTRWIRSNACSPAGLASWWAGSAE